MANVGHEFKQNQKFGLFFQIYGLAFDQSTLKPDVDLRIRFRQGDKLLLELADDLSQFGKLQGDGASVTVSLPLGKFPTGRIDLEVEVTDRIQKTSTRGSTSFVVTPVSQAGLSD